MARSRPIPFEYYPASLVITNGEAPYFNSNSPHIHERGNNFTLLFTVISRNCNRVIL